MSNNWTIGYSELDLGGIAVHGVLMEQTLKSNSILVFYAVPFCSVPCISVALVQEAWERL